MTYFDAAYIAKCYLNEPGAELVRRVARESEGLASCEFGRLEMFSIVQRHLREHRISRAEATATLAEFEKDEADGVWTWLPVTLSLIQGACRVLRTLPDIRSIRAADALHLACAAQNGFREIFTNDRHMLTGAKHFRLVARDVLSS